MFKTIKCFFITSIFLFFTSTNVFAVGQIPREEFIKYTDSCLDVVDEVEVLLSSSKVSLQEAKKLDKDYELCMKKYDRYGSNGERDRDSGSSAEFVGKFQEIEA